MNAGGDQGQDDYGLPPVDIEIPDDARELDPDVQAYHRELRAQRRRRMAGRLSGPLTRDGVALPVIAGCLALTMLAGALLAVFTSDRGPFGPVPHASTMQAQISPMPGQVNGLLPNLTVIVNGGQMPLRRLVGRVLVLALVPHSCGCLAHVQQLAREAAATGVRVYLAGMDGPLVFGLSRQVHLAPADVIQDPHNGLARAYRSAGLTAIVVRADGTVADIVADRTSGFRLQPELAALTSAARQ